MRKSKKARKLTRVRESLRYTSKDYTLAVRVSNKNIYVLVMCSKTRNVLTQVSTLTPAFKKQHSAETANVDIATELGKFAAKHILDKGYNKSFAYDRGTRQYSGKVKAVIESARASGILETENGD